MSKKTLRLILGDQLTADLSALRDIDRENDIVLMAEVRSASSTVGSKSDPQGAFCARQGFSHGDVVADAGG